MLHNLNLSVIQWKSSSHHRLLYDIISSNNAALALQYVIIDTLI